MYYFHFIVSWTFILNCLRGQTRAKPVQIQCQYAGGAAGAACPWQPAHPNPQESGFHAYFTFCFIPPSIVIQYNTFLLPYHTFLLPYLRLITPFFWYIIENFRFLAETTFYRMTQELVRVLYRLLYSTGI